MCVKAYIHMGTETFIYPHKYFIPLHYSILEKSTVKCQGSKILLINSLWILPHLLETLNNTFSLMDGKYGVNWGQGDRGCNNAMLRCSMTGIGPWESPRNRKTFFFLSAFVDKYTDGDWAVDAGEWNMDVVELGEGLSSDMITVYKMTEEKVIIGRKDKSINACM